MSLSEGGQLTGKKNSVNMENETPSSLTRPSTFQTYKYKYVILAVYFLNNVVNAIVWITFAPINSRTQEFVVINIILHFAF